MDVNRFEVLNAFSNSLITKVSKQIGHLVSHKRTTSNVAVYHEGTRTTSHGIIEGCIQIDELPVTPVTKSQHVPMILWSVITHPPCKKHVDDN